MKKWIVLLTLLMSFVLHAADNKSAVVSDKQQNLKSVRQKNQ